LAPKRPIEEETPAFAVGDELAVRADARLLEEPAQLRLRAPHLVLAVHQPPPPGGSPTRDAAQPLAPPDLPAELGRAPAVDEHDGRVVEAAPDLVHRPATRG
jgi:hypothetical protein